MSKFDVREYVQETLKFNLLNKCVAPSCGACGLRAMFQRGRQKVLIGFCCSCRIRESDESVGEGVWFWWSTTSKYKHAEVEREGKLNYL